MNLYVDVRDVAQQVESERRARLKWYVRPYSYDPRTVWQSEGVPLHPGAARYDREVGYMPAPSPQK